MAKDPFARLTLEWKLPIIVGALLLALTVALSVAAHLQLRRSALRAAEERLQGVVGQLTKLLETQARGIERRLLGTAQHPAVAAFLAAPAPGRADALIRELRREGASDNSFAGVVLRDTSGKVLATDGPLATELARILDRDELFRATTDSATVGRFRTLGDSAYFPALALLTREGRPLGYLTVWRRATNAPRGRGPVAELIGSDARMLFGSAGGAWIDEAGPAAPPDLSGPAEDGLLHYTRTEGEMIAAAKPVAGTPWMVVVEFPADTVLAPTRTFLRNILSIGAVLLLLGLVASWFLSRRITRPLARLKTAAEAMGHGDHQVRVEVERADEIGRLALVFNRMAERVDSEAAARAASEAQWRMVFDNSPHAMWVADPAGKLLAVNEAALRQYGYTREDFLRLRVAELELPIPEGEGAPLPIGPGIVQHRNRQGEPIDVEVSTNVLTFAGRDATLTLAQNVSARTALEGRLRQGQKMEAVGRLAGGVAHDFNNFLTVIGAYAELLKEDVPEGSRQAKDLDEILRASGQAHRLTRQLLAFSRQQVLKPSVMDANAAVQAMGEMLKRLIGEDVALTTRLESAMPRVRIDAGQFEQVLMNLAVNARDAMPGGGRLTIATADADLDAASALLHGFGRPGQYVTISVADTGIGMSAETRTRIFEPFFTTKASGKGTGLGLATVYGIVVQNDGQITVYSEPGIGSTFRIYLPRAEGHVEVHPAAADRERSLRGVETILLVEDEAAVRSATTDALVRFGYTVLPAPDAQEALDLIERHKGEIHLVISDIVMPGTDGPALIARLRTKRQGLKALLMSGYAGDTIARNSRFASDLPFLEKPFTVTGLARKVREVLEAR